MNWFKKHWIALLVSLIGVAIVSTSLIVLFWPQTLGASNVYMLKFSENTEQDKAKNKYISDLISKTQKAIDEYAKEYEQKYNTEFTGLDFKYINLKSAQTDGEKNFYFALNRALKAIDERLGIVNILRTPETVNQGFYNKNTELLSFYWSPDYNGVGTWLKYMFSDSFSMANFWPAIFKIMENNSQPWASSLKQELSKYTFDGKQSILLNHPELLAWINSDSNTTNMTVADAYVVIANVIGKWVKDNSQIDVIYHSDVNNESGEIVNNLVRYENEGLGIQFVNYIASNPASMPFVEDGPWTRTPWLVRDGFYNPTNPNSDNSFRDWFYEQDVINKNVIRTWLSASPFISSQTPFNPAFSNAPSSSFFKSAWVGLTSWTTIGDQNSSELPYEGSFLVSTGTTNTIEDLEHQFENSNVIKFKIRPIPWVDSSGNQLNDSNGQPAYLSPQDFIASIKGYLRSIECGLNSNNYFVNLLGLDVEKTLSDENNNLRNTSNTDEKVLTLYFSNRTLSTADCLDILQKQYFCAIPAFKESVQNIIDDELWHKYAVLASNGLLNTIQTDMNKFYGSGDWRRTWSDWAYAGPYYISNVTEQNIVFTINDGYFNAFYNEVNSSNPDIKNRYISFNKSYTFTSDITNKTHTINKFNTVDLKYAGSYNENIMFEQFKANELDVSPVQAANVVAVSRQYPNDMYYVSTSKINRSDLTSYNLQIYERDNNGYIIDANTNLGMVDENMNPTYTIDEFGNFDFQGKTPKLKSNVSQEYADLIVKDFFTPIEEGGISQLIRTTINNTINWISLQTLVFPGITKSIQYSFMPYGVYALDANLIEDNSSGIINTQPPPFNTTNVENFTKYWYYSSSKKYMSDEQLSIVNDENMKLRKSGSMIWTYDELLNAMIK